MLRSIGNAPQAARIALGVLFLVLACGALVAWLAGHANARAAAPAGDTPPAVATVRARAGSVAETMNATGRIGPPVGSDAKLAFPLAGIIATVPVRPGERVAAGDVLATLDRRPFANALAQAQADANAATATFAGGSSAAAAAASASAKYAAASEHLTGLQRGDPAALSDRTAAVSIARQATLKSELDRRALDRASTLFTGGVVAEKDVEAARSLYESDLADQRSAEAKVAAASAGYDAAVRQAVADAAQALSDLTTARAGVGVAAAQRNSALAKLAGAQTDYARGVLTAPTAGIIVTVLKHPGEAVDSTMPVVDVTPPLTGQITLTVPGTDALRIRVGNGVSLALTGTSTRLYARVSAVVPAVDPITQSTTVVVDAPIGNSVAGQAVSATIEVARTSGVLVPASAVVTDPQSGKTVVFVRNRTSTDAPFDSRDVTVRANDGTSAIVSSLRAGEEVAAQGAYDLLAPNGG